jgi:hypothetical protein
VEQRGFFASVDRCSREDPAEAFKGRAELDPVPGQPKFTDGMFVVSAALLDDGEGATDRAVELEVPQHKHSIAEIADIQRSIHRAHQPVLGQHQDREHAELTQIAQQFVHLQHQEALVGHRIEIAVQAIDDHYSRVVDLHGAPHKMGEFSRR